MLFEHEFKVHDSFSGFFVACAKAVRTIEVVSEMIRFGCSLALRAWLEFK
jgi:hypothetical protein